MSTRRGSAIRLPLLLAAVCAVLAAIVVAEAMPQADSSAAPRAASGAPSTLPPLPPDPEFAMPPEASFAAVVDRPVFSAGRRPIQGAGPAAAAGATAEIKLIGVIIADDEPIALVKLQNGDRLERLRQGEDLAGWSAVSIAPDRVVLRRGAMKEEIILDYKAPAPPAPPRIKRKVATVAPQPSPAMPATEQPQAAPDGQPAAPPEPAAQ